MGDWRAFRRLGIAALLPLGLALGMPAASAAAPAAAAVGNPVKGAQIFKRCMICHTIAPTDGNRIGPNLHGLFEREAGKQKGFNYSPGIAKSTFKWDDARLNLWLTDPQAFSPNAKMAFKLPDAQERADVIAYLHQVTEAK